MKMALYGRGDWWDPKEIVSNLLICTSFKAPASEQLATDVRLASSGREGRGVSAIDHPPTRW